MDRFVVRTPRILLNQPTVPHPTASDQDLPNPHLFADPSTAHEANNQAIIKMKESRKRKSYNSVPEDVKAKIGKYAAENGISKAISHFKGKVDVDLKMQSVFNWKKIYLNHLQKPETENTTRGRPVLLGSKIDTEIQQHIIEMRKEGAVVSHSVVNAVIRVYLKKHDLVRYTIEGEKLLANRSLAQSLLRRMGFVKRKGTKAAKKLPTNFDELKLTFYGKIQSVVKDNNVHNKLIINFDQTGVNILPSSSYTMEKEGAKQVSIIGVEDKRQITAVFAIDMDGNLLPPQLIYAGRTDKCHPKFQFPDEWEIDHTESHWSTAASMVRYAQRVLIPYVCAQRLMLNLSETQVAVVIFDTYNAQRHNDELHKLLKDNFIEFIYVPAACTGELQPLDADGGPNYLFKRLLKQEFSMWYSAQLMESLQLNNSSSTVSIPLSLTVLKPLHALWMVSAFNAMKRSDLRQCWSNTGILQVIEAIRN
jgi:hypothetical protein